MEPSTTENLTTPLVANPVQAETKVLTEVSVSPFKKYRLLGGIAVVIVLVSCGVLYAMNMRSKNAAPALSVLPSVATTNAEIKATSTATEMVATTSNLLTSLSVTTTMSDATSTLDTNTTALLNRYKELEQKLRSSKREVTDELTGEDLKNFEEMGKVSDELRLLDKNNIDTLLSRYKELGQKLKNSKRKVTDDFTGEDLKNFEEMKNLSVELRLLDENNIDSIYNLDTYGYKVSVFVNGKEMKSLEGEGASYFGRFMYEDSLLAVPGVDTFALKHGQNIITITYKNVGAKFPLTGNFSVFEGGVSKKIFDINIENKKEGTISTKFTLPYVTGTKTIMITDTGVSLE